MSAELEYQYAALRRPDRIYLTKSFPFPLARSRDFNQPTRRVRKVFDLIDGEPANRSGPAREVEVTTLSGTRVQVQAVVTRERGNVREIAFEKLDGRGRVVSLAVFDRESAQRLMLLMRALQYVDAEGTDTSRLDDEFVSAVFDNPTALAELYLSEPKTIRRLIESDENATDVIAIARRREAVEYFRRLLDDNNFFDAQSGLQGGPESVWQHFFEANSWVLGLGLSAQFLTAWDANRLEQTVRGAALREGGKRSDALLATSGAIGSLVFAEIKHHRTPLLGAEYRSDAWQPSLELSGAVAQVQQTAHLARRQLGELVSRRDEDGSELGEPLRLIRPRSYVVIGSLDQLRGPMGGIHQSRFESFEMFRRNLYEPEVLTFDEVLARAEWQVRSSEPQ